MFPQNNLKCGDKDLLRVNVFQNHNFITASTYKPRSRHMFIHMEQNSSIIMAIFLAHPAGESFFVCSRTFAAIMPL